MRRRTLSGIVLGVVLWAGCHEREIEPAYNRNLGTAEAPLLPPQSVLPDTNILDGPRVRPLELPEFNKDMPTLAEIEGDAAGRSDESAHEEDSDDLSANEVGEDEDQELDADADLDHEYDESER